MYLSLFFLKPHTAHGRSPPHAAAAAAQPRNTAAAAAQCDSSSTAVQHSSSSNSSALQRRPMDEPGRLGPVVPKPSDGDWERWDPNHHKPIIHFHTGCIVIYKYRQQWGEGIEACLCDGTSRAFAAGVRLSGPLDGRHSACLSGIACWLRASVCASSAASTSASCASAAAAVAAVACASASLAMASSAPFLVHTWHPFLVHVKKKWLKIKGSIDPAPARVGNV